MGSTTNNSKKKKERKGKQKRKETKERREKRKRREGGRRGKGFKMTLLFRSACTPLQFSLPHHCLLSQSTNCLERRDYTALSLDCEQL